MPGERGTAGTPGPKGEKVCFEAMLMALYTEYVAKSVFLLQLTKTFLLYTG